RQPYSAAVAYSVHIVVEPHLAQASAALRVGWRDRREHPGYNVSRSHSSSSYSFYRVTLAVWRKAARVTTASDYGRHRHVDARYSEASHANPNRPRRRPF